jgi:ornithine cyclodeaminase
MADAIAEGHRGPRPRIGDLFLTRGGETLQARAAWIDGVGAASKTFTVMPGNGARGLPTVQGALLIFDDGTGRLLAVIDSELVTRWKTAADSLLGARILARPDVRRLLVVGAGSVADALVDAYRAGFPGLAVAVWSRTAATARTFAGRKGAEAARGLAAAVAAADIIACATTARSPVIEGAWLRPGQHLDLVGAYRADMREADDTALRRARIFVDSFATTLGHIGELEDPLARGVIGRADVLGDLHDLVAGRVGRRGPEEITLYKNGGGAHLDLMAGRAILAAWRAAGGA